MPPLCLVGAGFNADAAHEAGYSPYGRKEPIDCGYPLLADALRLCFGMTHAPRKKSIEELFEEARERRDNSPLEKLAGQLMKADYRLAWQLVSSQERHCYGRFFERFQGSHFLTFNYDGLIEIFLLRLGRWRPHDGYGVPAEVAISPAEEAPALGESASLVLHLHGTLYLDTSELQWQRNPGEEIALLVQRDRPLYVFDPDSAAHVFAPWERGAFHLGHREPEQRIIAPVPNKAAGLRGAFVRAVYAKARDLVRACSTLVAIGYSFGAHDRCSYRPILQALGESRDRKLVIVSPDAGKLARRLRNEYPQLNVEPVEETLRSWAAASFRGMSGAQDREGQSGDQQTHAVEVHNNRSRRMRG